MSYRSLIGKSVRELRFVLCQQNQNSLGTRQFIKNNYLDIKAQNPTTPFIVRECLGAQPNVMARYDFGVERRIYLHDLTEQEVDEAVAELVNQADSINNSVAGAWRVSWPSMAFTKRKFHIISKKDSFIFQWTL